MKSDLAVRSAALLVALAGCKAQPQATPEAAYQSFVQAAGVAHAMHDPKLLLEFFDAPTRAALESRAKAAADATGKTLSDDAAYQLLLGGPGAPALAELQVASNDGDHATLRVATDGGPAAEVKMVREQGRWKLHLDALDIDAGRP